MAVNPYDPSQPTSTSQVELSAELRALKGVNVNHRDKIQVLEDQIVPVLGITPYGQEVIELTSVEANLALLGGGTAGIEVFQQNTVDEIVSLLGLAGASLIVEHAGGKTCVTWNTGLMLQIVNLNCPPGGVIFTWLKPFPTQILGVIPGLNSNASNAAAVDNITTSGARADQGNASNQDVSIWALGR